MDGLPRCFFCCKSIVVVWFWVPLVPWVPRVRWVRLFVDLADMKARGGGGGAVLLKFCGVVPYAVDSTGSICVLLAREAFGRDKNMWSAFAGRVDAADDRSVPEAIAARECYEESMGILGSAEDLNKVLREKATRVDVKDGIHYLLPMVFDDTLPRRFMDTRATVMAAVGSATYSPFLEKDQVMWMPVQNIKVSTMRFRPGFWRDIDFLSQRLAQTCALT
jgi:hypothetical protein